jgi:DinB superfamily
MAALPPWPTENHVCGECGFGYAELAVADVPGTVRVHAEAVRRVVTALSPDQLARRPDPDTWSPIEYLCHLRDVYEVTTIRLHRARVEDRPLMEPMYNDLRARRFGYRDREAAAVVDELDAAVAGCCDELARVGDWHRTVVRQPGEERSTAWLARNAVHEGHHHLRDLQHAVRLR